MLKFIKVTGYAAIVAFSSITIVLPVMIATDTEVPEAVVNAMIQIRWILY